MSDVEKDLALVEQTWGERDADGTTAVDRIHTHVHKLETEIAIAWDVLGKRTEGSTMTLAEGIKARHDEAYQCGVRDECYTIGHRVDRLKTRIKCLKEQMRNSDCIQNCDTCEFFIDSEEE